VTAATVINLAITVFLVAAAVVLVRLCRTRRPYTPARHDVGPDALLLLQDLDAHLDAHAAQLAGLYERLGPPGSEWDAGLERLWDAVRDHQKGDQA
jgi:hypothetical protein